MKHLAEVLEFFEDFYAGFLQILLQLYILFLDFAEQKSLGVGFCKFKISENLSNVFHYR